MKRVSPDDQKLFEYIEKELGELSPKQKKQAKKYSKAITGYKNCSKPNIEPIKKFTWRYFTSAAVSAVLSVAICLSIFLPILFDRDNDGSITPPEIKDYTTYIPIFTEEDEIRKDTNLLLFSKAQTSESQFGQFGSAVLEFAVDAPILLGYNMANCVPMINNGDMFLLNYRIRTYKNYFFAGYHDDYYATLEDTYTKKATALNETVQNFTVDKIYDKKTEVLQSETLIINGFTVNEIPILCYIRQSDMTADTGYIYFLYNNYEYFIEISDVFELKPDASYVKDIFILALFSNVVTI